MKFVGGRERKTSENDEIVDRSRSALAEVLKETALRCGGQVCEEDGLLLVAANHPCPVLMNSALRMGAMEPDEVLRRAQAFFGGLGHGWETWVREGVDADLEMATRGQGMTVAPDLVGMITESAPDLPEPRPGVELRRVTDLQGLQEFSMVAADGLREEAPGFSDLIHAVFSEPRVLLAPDTAAFVVRYWGQPASTAMMMLKEDVAWIGWVATRPCSRRLGLGLLATAAATRAGFELGAKFASLEATEMGITVYLRLGYREIVRYRNYWPAGFGMIR
jgi:GNAT superfamily N-acetyltransferase